MRLLGVVALVAVAAAIGFAIWRSGLASSPATASPPADTVVQAATADRVSAPVAPPVRVAPDAATIDEGPRAATPRAVTPRAETSHDSAMPQTDAVMWPITKRQGAQAAHAGARTAPTVPVDLAFQALRYVGVDPAAEATWLAAINDSNTPPEARSDLIEDLNQEGYGDNDRPTAADLPLVRARLRLIERLAADAADEVNAAAFAEAYKDLLEMYVRLGGDTAGR